MSDRCSFATAPGLMVTGVSFRSLVAEGDLLETEVDIHFDGSGTLLGRDFSLTQTGFFTFDLSLLNLGVAVNPCSRFVDCVRFMSSLPFGSYDRVNSNTFVCRELHSLLTPIRPDIHCPHRGKSGGMACVDLSYESYYETDF